MHKSTSMKKLRTSESGIISIFIATLLIIIVSLLVMAFAQISRREQRESLDTQLSSQAFYAAETGVNDMKAVLKNYIDTHPGAVIPPRDDCNDTSTPYNALSGTKVLSTDPGNVSYTCVRVDPDPPFLPVKISSTPQVLPLKTANGRPFTTVTLSWTAATSAGAPSVASCPAAAGAFPAAAADAAGTMPVWNCAYGGIRMDLVPFKGNQSQDSLQNANMAAFLMPSKNVNNNSGVAYAGGSASGSVVAANNCPAPTFQCSVTLNVAGANSSVFYLRLSQLYLPSTVTVTGVDNANTAVSFKDAVALVDSTGKSQDVLRRIVVGVPLQRTSASIPDSALNTGDSICKRFRVNINLFTNDMTNAGTNNNQVNAQPGLANPYCSP
jgi:hypothetical protein